MSDEAKPPEVYSLGNNAAWQTRMAGRSAAQFAAHLLPHLRPGLRVLDAGCGPGSITLGLAEAVAPGEVVGVDEDETAIDAARAAAAVAGVVSRRLLRRRRHPSSCGPRQRGDPSHRRTVGTPNPSQGTAY